MILKNIGVALILLGGAGLIFIKANTLVWYLSTILVVIGFIVMYAGGKKEKK